ncbi:flagellar export chaperone FliS [Pandoraea nosoerga]|uniref:Flagellar secretion chaperone FliS n=1 Tax=Pandoraea nosoerga TaxID=2508296 RepID=A0A5E4XXZ1_9BURK|nr:MULTISPECIES: flagellar export chaperone FliS [Pandoraea]MBN4664787.1 flagellar export chaperone FliS [Pandoraea nosoerga]MBN4674039.1 flagellar export chaperone FliS [Pandoraea nosoerga]MBN4680027.1 flagellar export chaperone FliS [Pandoraea nosoerga]MBN4744261.1 flagellar export chaperone FliS [Pandoraea nosoerga]VVE41210.1 flagellar biosynthesis protein FliS [Pandoraea nosoerga]
MYGQNAANAYRKVGLETGVIAASPHQLIVMLFDGAKAALTRARVHFEDGRIAERGQAISKAIEIIGGLRDGLNMEVGGELSRNLRDLYDYMGRRLLEANLENDVAKVREVDTLLDTIASAWREIAPAAGTGAAAAQAGTGVRYE